MLQQHKSNNVPTLKPPTHTRNYFKINPIRKRVKCQIVCINSLMDSVATRECGRQTLMATVAKWQFTPRSGSLFTLAFLT